MLRMLFHVVMLNPQKYHGSYEGGPEMRLKSSAVPFVRSRYNE